MIYCGADLAQALAAHVTQAATGNRRPLLRASEVCELLKVQTYVLRSWEKEFPNLGISKTPDGPRLYRRSDVEEALRIKQLVYGEGLTIAGARRRLEEERAATTDELPFEDFEEDAPSRGLSKQVRARIERVRRGLQSILELLDKGRERAALSPNGHQAAGAAPAGPPRKTRAAAPVKAARKASGKKSGRRARA